MTLIVFTHGDVDATKLQRVLDKSEGAAKDILASIKLKQVEKANLDLGQM